MLQYPSILGSAHAPLGVPCIAFQKYDGSNLRWEWSPKSGWAKYGTRRQLFNKDTPLYNQAIPPFSEIGDEIVYQVKKLDKSIQRITAFTEFFGPSSFAGQHVHDEPKELRLLDVFLFKKGFIPPKQFVSMFGKRKYSPEVIYTGNLNSSFIQDVRDSFYDTPEGVICKGNEFMVKIKTKAYFVKLYDRFQDDWEKYSE